MFTVAIIAFREFLEAFLIVGVFFGISRRLRLRKETEIGIAALLGIVISLFIAALTFIFADFARGILTEENAEFLESYLLIFSGLFITYVVFSLHTMLHWKRGATIIKAHKKLQQNVFDVSLFLTIVFLVVREGFEIALFTSTTSLFSVFIQNMIGLLLGFAGSAIVGASTFFAYLKFPINKVFKFTEYMIVLLGASFVQNGTTKLTELHFDIHLEDILPIHLGFLPDKESLFGHLLGNLFGLDREFSLLRLSIMLTYMGAIYLLFIKQKRKAT